MERKRARRTTHGAIAGSLQLEEKPTKKGDGKKNRQGFLGRLLQNGGYLRGNTPAVRHRKRYTENRAVLEGGEGATRTSPLLGGSVQVGILWNSIRPGIKGRSSMAKEVFRRREQSLPVVERGGRSCVHANEWDGLESSCQ